MYITIFFGNAIEKYSERKSMKNILKTHIVKTLLFSDEGNNRYGLEFKF